MKSNKFVATLLVIAVILLLLDFINFEVFQCYSCGDTNVGIYVEEYGKKRCLDCYR